MKWFLPILFIGYYSTVSLFMHVHIEHGTTIVHAHPFKTAPDGTCHHHARLAEIQLFHLLSSIYAADGAVHPLQINYFAYQTAEIAVSPFSSDYVIPVKGNSLLRAPPFMV